VEWSGGIATWHTKITRGTLSDLKKDNPNHGPDEAKVLAVDFDKTLAEHNSDTPYNHQRLGEPIPEMVERVKAELAKGRKVVIFTARANPGNTYQEQMQATESYLFIADWCREVFGTHLPITFVKSKDFEEIWDDRAKEVIPNTGQFAMEQLVG
jgi:hypothetical protein